VRRCNTRKREQGGNLVRLQSLINRVCDSDHVVRARILKIDGLREAVRGERRIEVLGTGCVVLAVGIVIFPRSPALVTSKSPEGNLGARVSWVGRRGWRFKVEGGLGGG
jgi:hypothetical protein